ncbi:AMP-binding enzyme family protein, partial [Aphelenchoides avenae]
MVTVKCQMETLEGLVVPNGVEISAYVADNIFVLVGPHEVMSAFLERLREAKIEHRELKTERGFHSYMLDPIVDEFKAYAEDASVYSDMQVPVISNVDGSVMKSPQLNAAYLTQHLRRPVRVDLTLDTLIHDFDEISCIVEIGPPGLLQTLLRIRKPDIK